MGLRFRKTVKLAKGVNLNFSGKGVGWSAGIPGTGVRYVASPGGKGKAPKEGGGCGGCAVLLAVAVAGLLILGMLSPKRADRPVASPPSAPSPPATLPQP